MRIFVWQQSFGVRLPIEKILENKLFWFSTSLNWALYRKFELKKQITATGDFFAIETGICKIFRGRVRMVNLFCRLNLFMNKNL